MAFNNNLRRGTVAAVAIENDIVTLDVNCLADETLADVLLFQPACFNAVPKIGDQVLVLLEGGDTNSAYALLHLDVTGRPQMGTGAPAMYNHAMTGLVLIANDGRVVQLSGPPGNYQTALISDPDGTLTLSANRIVLDAKTVVIAGDTLTLLSRAINTALTSILNIFGVAFSTQPPPTWTPPVTAPPTEIVLPELAKTYDPRD